MDAEAAYLQGAWEKAAVLLERARADAAGQENMTLCCDFWPCGWPCAARGKRVRFCRQARRPAAKARRGAGASAGKHRRLFLRFAGQAGAGPGAVPGAQAGRGELLWALPPHDVPHRAAGLAGAGGVREGDRPQRGPAAPVRGHARLVGLQARIQLAAAQLRLGQRAEARAALAAALLDAVQDDFWVLFVEQYPALAPCWKGRTGPLASRVWGPSWPASCPQAGPLPPGWACPPPRRSCP